MDVLHSPDPVATFQASASMEHWDEFNAFVQSQADRYLGPGKQNYNLRLACEELVSNIIRHAGDGEPTRAVTLRLSAFLSGSASAPRSLIVELRDDGPFFDPQFEDERRIDKHLPAADRPIGGLGLFLVQQSVDRAEYIWIDGMNCYRLTVDMDATATV